MASKALADLPRHFLGPCHDLIKAAELIQPLGRGFRAHLGNARDVIDAIPGEGQQVDDLLRIHPKLFPHPGLIQRGISHGVHQRHLGGDQLGKILVGGGNDHGAVGSGLGGEGTDHVVRLDLGDHDEGETVGANHLMKRGNLRPEIGIHGRPMGLVLGVKVTAKGFPRRIKNHREGAFGVALAQPAKHVHHAADRPRGLPIAGG